MAKTASEATAKAKKIMARAEKDAASHDAVATWSVALRDLEKLLGKRGLDGVFRGHEFDERAVEVETMLADARERLRAAKAK